MEDNNNNNMDTYNSEPKVIKYYKANRILDKFLYYKNINKNVLITNRI